MNVVKKRVLSMVLMFCIVLGTFNIENNNFDWGLLELESALLPQSGDVRLDTDPIDGYTGDYVMIYNDSPDISDVKSTGILQGLSNQTTFANDRFNNEQNAKVDFHPEILPPNMLTLPTAAASYTVGDKKTFNLVNPMTNATSSKEFTLKYAGSESYVWVDESFLVQKPSIGISGLESYAKTVGQAFDDDIHDSMVANFGQYLDADKTGKVSLLLYDIPGGSASTGYVAGYFYSKDLQLSDNGTAMLHIDINEGASGSSGIIQCLPTVVHEFQHLINYSQYYLHYEENPSTARNMSTWLNEAMSMAAEESLFEGSVVSSRLRTYSNSGSNYIIKNGQSLYTFESKLIDYSMSALFGQYLKSQTEGYDIFSRISSYYRRNDITPSEKTAIEQAVQGTALQGMTFEEIVAAFKISLVANDKTGLYGFRGVSAISDNKNLPKLVYTDNNTTVALKGGGSILIKPVSGTYNPPVGANPNLKYVGIRPNVKVTSVKISGQPTDNLLGVGVTYSNLRATVIPSEYPASWHSSNTAVAIVDPVTGEIKTISSGTVRITANAGGTSDFVDIKVSDTGVAVQITNRPLNDRLTIQSVSIGSSVTTHQLDKKLIPSTATVMSTAWTSSNPTVADISSTGLITAKNAGTSTITVTVTLPDGKTESDTFVLIVLDTSAKKDLYIKKGSIKITKTGYTQSPDTIETPHLGGYNIVGWVDTNGNGDITDDNRTSARTENKISTDGYNGQITIDSVTIIPNADPTQLTAPAFSIKNGNVTVNLVGTNSLTSGNGFAGLSVNKTDTAELTIMGTIADELFALGGKDGAGIGGDSGNTNGRITIVGGTIVANAENQAASIGGGKSGNGENITIIGDANVTAGNAGNSSGAGIGGGDGNQNGTGGNGENITIGGNATVTATALGCSAGIGGGGWQTKEGWAKNIFIKDSAKVTAEGGSDAPGIGGGCGYTDGGSGADNIQITLNPDGVVHTTGKAGAGIGSGHIATNPVTNILISGGTVTAISTSGGAGIGGGKEAKVGTRGITITGGTVTAISNNGGAGIGGGVYALGIVENIAITGGTVTATGGAGGAGIGAGQSITDNSASAKNISITGGTVNATGGSGGAGIGGAASTGDKSGNAADIFIYGGTVTAKGGANAAGIGGGVAQQKNSGDAANIQITGGRVTATGGVNGSGIGGSSVNPPHFANNIPADQIWHGGNLTGLIIKEAAVVTATGGVNGNGIGGGNVSFKFSSNVSENKGSFVGGSATGINISNGSKVTAAGGAGGSGIAGGTVIADIADRVYNREDGAIQAGKLDVAADNSTVIAQGENVGIGGGAVVNPDGKTLVEDDKIFDKNGVATAKKAEAKVSFSKSSKIFAYSGSAYVPDTITGRPAIDKDINSAAVARADNKAQIFNFQLYETVPTTTPIRVTVKDTGKPIFDSDVTVELPQGYGSFAFTVPDDKVYNLEALVGSEFKQIVTHDTANNPDFQYSQPANTDLKVREIHYSTKATKMFSIETKVMIKDANGNLTDGNGGNVFDDKGLSMLGKKSYPEGTIVAMRASPIDNYKFLYVQDKDGKQSPIPSKYVSVHKDEIYTFVFEKTDKYIVTTIADPTEGGTIIVKNGQGNIRTNSTEFAPGEPAVITATPNEGYLLKDGYIKELMGSDPDGALYENVGTTVNGVTTYTIPAVNSNRTFVAMFIKPKVKVTISTAAKEGGLVKFSVDNVFVESETKEIDKNSVAQIVAEPKSGYRFVRWTVAGTEVSTAAVYTIPLDRDGITYVAHFEKIPPISPPITDPPIYPSSSSPNYGDSSDDEDDTYSVTFISNPKGAGTMEGWGYYKPRQNVTISATPNYGYTFSHWVSESGNRINQNPYRFSIYSDKVFTAVFLPTQAPLVKNPSTGFEWLDNILKRFIK